MSVFSEQNTRLAQGLVDAKAAIEAKKGSVTVAKTTPQIEEIVAGISTVKADGGATEPYVWIESLTVQEALYIDADANYQGAIDFVDPLDICIDIAPINYFDLPTLLMADTVTTIVS